MFLFVLFDSLHPINNLIYVGTGLVQSALLTRDDPCSHVIHTIILKSPELKYSLPYILLITRNIHVRSQSSYYKHLVNKGSSYNIHSPKLIYFNNYITNCIIMI